MKNHDTVFTTNTDWYTKHVFKCLKQSCDRLQKEQEDIIEHCHSKQSKPDHWKGKYKSNCLKDTQREYIDTGTYKWDSDFKYHHKRIAIKLELEPP